VNLNMLPCPQAWSPAGPGFAALIYVRFVGPGWLVEGQDFESLAFGRGLEAEGEARRLARAYAKVGKDASVMIYDAGDRLAGAIDYYGVQGPLSQGRRSRYPWSA
jgi:hypothetical protein